MRGRFMRSPRKTLLAGAIAAAMLTTQGCSGLDFLSAALAPQPAVAVSAQVGEEANQQIIAGNQNKNGNRSRGRGC